MRIAVPAQVKIALLCIGAVIVCALVFVAPFRPVRTQRCAPLLESVEAVRSGRAQHQASHLWRYQARLEKYGWRSQWSVAERGDFGGAYTRRSLQACLGEDWIEREAIATQPPCVVEAWTYRSGESPQVTYRMGVDRHQVVVDAAM